MHASGVCQSVRAPTSWSSFSQLIALNNFIKHHTHSEFLIACCLREVPFYALGHTRQPHPSKGEHNIHPYLKTQQYLGREVKEVKGI